MQIKGYLKTIGLYLQIIGILALIAVVAQGALHSMGIFERPWTDRVFEDFYGLPVWITLPAVIVILGFGLASLDD